MSASSSARRIAVPLNIGLDPMERLVVASFKGDPEYVGLESQVFDDPTNGKGMRVLRQRKDGKIDVYWQAGVNVDPATISIGAGIGDFAEVSIDPAHFEITPSGVDLHCAFQDAQGRKVELKVIEHGDRSSRFPFLAPVGDQVSEPQRLFLVYMLDFDFVRRRGTNVHAAIGNRELRPASIPLLRAGRRILLMRYSTRPVIGFFNPPMDRPTLFETVVPGTVAIGGMRMRVDASGRVAEVASGGGVESVQFDFSPGFPNLLGLSETEAEKGTWTVHIAGAPITGGTYYVRRTGSTVASRIDITRKWSPSGLPPGCALLTKVVPSFRNWPTTYRWKGTVQLDEGLALTGGWKRTASKEDQ
ncbi:MAG: hypothetical protein JXA87_09940 [Thermoleophilia bacterium]|nr:hypothetical protein [Thermoleophilia bacterium]